MSKEHSPLPWVLDGAGGALIVADMESQADQLLKNAGTPLEWRAVGVPDPDGLAEIVALAHPTNAEFIVRCVNAHDDLVHALNWLLSAFYDGGEGGPEATLNRQRAAAINAEVVLHKHGEVPCAKS